MANQLSELRERLLQAGIAPRHVRRYLAELDDHVTDLTAAKQAAGHSPADAEQAAFSRLGTPEDLALAMTQHRRFHSWCTRAPWAVFGLAPLLLLIASWCVTVLMLWLGWKLFLPTAATPFGRHPGAHARFDLGHLYFQANHAFYYLVPIVLGWSIGLIAARQRVKAWWPIASLILIAVIGGAAQVHANRFPGGQMSIGVGLDIVPSLLGNLNRILQAVVILAVTLLPYLIWRGVYMEQDLNSFGAMVRRPSAFLPLAMSLSALTMLLVPIAVAIGRHSGVPRDPDEGDIAHLWQLLMTVQIPIVLFFAVKWLRRTPRPTLGILALQAGAWLASCAPIYFLHL
jgi:predicted anti-sigma-YlaC factor YlaD